ncbi:MAG TPA: disulfide bond formation protein B [Gammaproteobacteria bacterium]|nr:disulfide bond formation protein B [Gammaproteobacteria bacterium]
MRFFCSRVLNVSGFIICCLLLAAAYYLQYIQGIQPCPLCMLQRLVFMALAIILFVAMLHNPKKTGVRIYGALTLIMAIAGVLLAWRHIWLQLHPKAATEICVPGYAYLMTLPFVQAMRFLFQSSENCSHIIQVWGLSIPFWTLLCFAGFGVLALTQIVFAQRLNKH